MCRAAETSKSQLKTIQGESNTRSSQASAASKQSSPSVTVRCCKKSHKPAYQQKNNSYLYNAQGQGPKKEVKPCSKCRTRHYPKPCPALDKTCNKRHRRNHFAKECRTRKKKVHTVEDQFQYYAYDNQDRHRFKPYRSQDEEDSDPGAGLFIRELVMVAFCRF